MVEAIVRRVTNEANEYSEIEYSEIEYSAIKYSTMRVYSYSWCKFHTPASAEGQVQ